MTISVKICGLTNRDDAVAALDHGADYIGFVFYDRSPRCADIGKVAEIVSEIGDACPAVGVFVNHDRASVLGIVERCGLTVAQLHGDEVVTDFGDMPVPVWRAVKLRAGTVSPGPADWLADRYVIDADVKGLYGGTGIVADWSAAADFAGQHPSMLAGGLTADNVAGAIEAVLPLGVDVSSGIELEPGRKDLGKLARFIAAAKGGEC